MDEKEKYPWLQEYRPFPISAQKSSSTVQDRVDPSAQIHVPYEDYHFVNDSKEKQEFVKKHYPRAWEGQDISFDQIKI